MRRVRSGDSERCARPNALNIKVPVEAAINRRRVSIMIPRAAVLH